MLTELVRIKVTSLTEVSVIWSKYPPHNSIHLILQWSCCAWAPLLELLPILLFHSWLLYLFIFTFPLLFIILLLRVSIHIYHLQFCHYVAPNWCSALHSQTYQHCTSLGSAFAAIRGTFRVAFTSFQKPPYSFFLYMFLTIPIID